MGDKTFVPTMQLRVRRYTNWSRAETHGAEHEDTLQQLWVALEPDGYDDTEWRDVEIWVKE